MMKSIRMLAALLAVSLSAMVGVHAAEKIAKGTMWTDGFVSFNVIESSGKLVKMVGGSLHEGGYELPLTVTADGYRVEPQSADFPEFAAWGEVGSPVERKTIAGHDLLVATSVEAPGTICAVLERFDGNELAHEEGVIHRALMGSFLDESKTSWIFTPDGKVQMPGHSLTAYAIQTTYDMPVGVISLPDGTYARPVVSVEGIELYEAKRNPDDEDDWLDDTNGEPRFVLTRTSAPDFLLDMALTEVLWPGLTSVVEVNELAALLNQLEGRTEPLVEVNKAMLWRMLNAMGYGVGDDGDDEEGVG